MKYNGKSKEELEARSAELLGGLCRDRYEKLEDLRRGVERFLRSISGMDYGEDFEDIVDSYEEELFQLTLRLEDDS
jgi:hypothetical protein